MKSEEKTLTIPRKINIKTSADHALCNCEIALKVTQDCCTIASSVQSR